MKNDILLHYKVAELPFDLQLADDDKLNQLLTNYEPFIITSPQKPIFHLTVVPEQAELMDLSSFTTTPQHSCINDIGSFLLKISLGRRPQ